MTWDPLLCNDFSNAPYHNSSGYFHPWPLVREPNCGIRKAGLVVALLWEQLKSSIQICLAASVQFSQQASTGVGVIAIYHSEEIGGPQGPPLGMGLGWHTGTPYNRRLAQANLSSALGLSLVSNLTHAPNSSVGSLWSMLVLKFEWTSPTNWTLNLKPIP